MRTNAYFIICLFMTLSVQSVFATKITWKTGVAINVNWNEPTNWDLNRIPISTDSVFTFYSDIIELPTNYTAEINFMRHLGTLTIPADSELIFTNGQFEAFGTLHNYGVIRVNNSPDEGIVCSTQAANRPFNNFGNIFVENAATKGLVISSNQVITNAAGALIEITNSGEESMALGYPFLNGIINNSGIVKIGVGGNGIGLKIDNSDSEFNNLACGRVILLDKLVMSAGKFDNSGFLKQDFDGDNDLGVIANTTFNNYGVVEDLFESFYFSDFDIQSIWIKYIPFKVYKTGEKVSIFTLNAPTGINMGDIYADNALTQLAGSYNQNTNIWIPNSTANGKSEFFIRISQQSNTCFDTVEFNLQYPIVAVNYWLGGTGAWQTAAKWSTGSVPTSSVIAAIYNTSDVVGISNYTASAKKIFLGGKLTNTTTGVLNVGGTAADRGVVLEEGILINNGSINIYQSSTGIDIENAAFTNNNLIKCNNTLSCIEVDGFSGLIASFVNTGTIENTGGILINGDETELNNSGSLIGYNPTFESIKSSNLINTGTITIEGDGANGTGYSGNILNEVNGSISLKSLSSGGKFYGENRGLITSELCTYGFELSGPMTNANGGKITANNNSTGMRVGASVMTNVSGGIIELNNNIINGLWVPEPSSFFDPSPKLVNEGVIKIKGTLGEGINIGGIVTNQVNGRISVKESSSHGIHQKKGSLENRDQAELNIKQTTGHGIFNEGGQLINNFGAELDIDSVGMSALYFGDFLGDFGYTYGYMTNYSHLEIGAQVVGNGIYLEPSTYITNYECSGEIINKSNIQLNGLFTNNGVYQHLNAGSSSIGSNLMNNGVTYDPFVVLTSPGTWNIGMYIGQKTGTFSEDETINDILDISASISTGFEAEASWFINENLSIPAGDYDESQNTFIPLGSLVDSSKVYFTVTNLNCIPAKVHKFSLKLENSINKVCGKILWDGGKGTFSTFANWSKYRLPGVCDSIIIGAVLDSVLINTALPIEVGHISNKGYLFLKSGSNLSVMNSTGNGIRNEGEILVRGSLNIENISQNAYVGAPNSLLTNDGVIMIDNIMQRGLVLNNAILENKVNASLTIQNALLEELRLTTGSVLTQKGTLILNE